MGHGGRWAKGREEEEEQRAKGTRGRQLSVGAKGSD